MIDINLIRDNPELVKENIRKKFQDHKLPLVDEVAQLDRLNREAIARADSLRGQRNSLSKQIGGMMQRGEKAQAEAVKQQVKDMQDELAQLEVKEEEYARQIREKMMQIPQIIDQTVPVGRNDSENVENERFGEPVTPEFEIPYHVDIMERLSGIDLDSARKTSGNGFYYLKGDIARLHSAILSYARDFMIDRGFTYYVPPFMIRSEVVTGVMSFTEMENMMYKIEGEDLYLIGTSEHSMIGKFIDTILRDEADCRLGAADRLVVFDPAPPGPFGQPVQQLALRHHMLQPSLPADAQPDTVQALPDQPGFNFRLGSRQYRYSRYGLERISKQD